jgi:hypothetical protein
MAPHGSRPLLDSLDSLQYPRYRVAQEGPGLLRPRPSPGREKSII